MTAAPTVTITRTTPEPAADQRPPMLRLHLMTGAELMEMVERIANRRREFLTQIGWNNECAYAEPCKQCIHPACKNYGKSCPRGQYKQSAAKV